MNQRSSGRAKVAGRLTVQRVGWPGIWTDHDSPGFRPVPAYGKREIDMLKGSKPALVKKVQPVSIHGQISLDVYVVDPDDPQGQVSLARLGEEDVPRDLEPGDRVSLHYLVGVVTRITKP